MALGVGISQPGTLGAASTSGGLQGAAGIPGTVTSLTNNAPAPAQSPAVQGGGSNVSSLTGTSINAPEYISGIQQEYNSAIGQGSNLIAQNQANLPINEQLLNAYTTAQQNAATNQVQNQVNTYDTQKQGVQSQQQLSLAELADQIRGQNQGLQQQLGAVGAGDSSASGLGQFALAHEQNENRANVQQQAGSNIADINAQIQQTQNTLQPYLDTLTSYKNQQMQSIIQNYNTLQTQLEQQIGQAKGEEKARLAEFGQSLTDSAGAALTALDQQVQGAASTFASQQQSALANQPAAFQAPPLQNAPAAIQSPSVSPFQVSTPTANSTAPSGGSLSALLNQ